MKQILNFFLYLLFLAAGLPFRILPYTAAQKLGYLLVRFSFLILKKYRKIIESNLQHAFPGREPDFYRKIYKENLKHTGRLVADTFLKRRMDKNWFEKHIITDGEVKNIENEILRQLENSEPVILLSGHLGTWENLVQYVGLRYFPRAGIIYKTIKNPFVDGWFFRVRKLTGAQLFSMEETMQSIRFLQNGNLLGIAPDQNAGSAGIMVPFLNRPASTYKGPAYIGTVCQAHLYFIAMLHLSGGKLKLVYHYLGRIPGSNRENREILIKEWTEKWIHTLEDYIKNYPEQYFWVHRRWKTTPEIMETFRLEKLKKRGVLKEKMPETKNKN